VKLRSFLALAAIAVAGCGDDPVSPGADSVLSFSYTGAGAAAATSFSAAGQIPANVQTSFGSTSWAAGAAAPTVNYATVAASIPRTATTYNFIAIGVTRKTVGTSPVDATCDDPEATNCTGVFVFFDFNPDGDDMAFGCYLTAGSVTITSITSEKIAGTFSGTGTCLSDAFTESEFAITNGAFDVDVTAQIFEGARARAAHMGLLRRAR
jgi:hypothetical protein